MMKHCLMDWVMNLKKGDIYLANLGDRSVEDIEDIGKIRPVLIFQNDLLNRMIGDSLYQDVIVIPLSSKLIESDFTLIIDARDKLRQKSVILCNAMKMINANRILVDKGVLSSLSQDEILEIERKLYDLFGCSIK